MSEKTEVDKIAIEHIKIYLEANDQVVAESWKNKAFDEKGLDLLSVRMNESNLKITTISVTGDESKKTKDFYLEMIKDKERKTKGCFLTSEVSYLFYYFIESKELYTIPFTEAKEWVRKNRDKFELKDVQKKKGGEFIESQGLLVPKKMLSENVNVKKFHLDYYISEKQTKLGLL